MSTLPAAAHSSNLPEYRDVPGWTGYRVGDDGTVWSAWAFTGRPGINRSKIISPRWRLLKGYKNVRSRYWYVDLTDAGCREKRAIHRLVLEAFVGPCPEGMECRHLDGNRDNNRLDNLCWGTRKENAADTVAHGRSRRGEKNPHCSMTSETARKIQGDLSAGMSVKDVAAKHGVGFGAVMCISRGESWAWLKSKGA